jgi:hypothetical protein
MELRKISEVHNLDCSTRYQYFLTTSQRPGTGIVTINDAFSNAGNIDLAKIVGTGTGTGTVL